jgi:hypothetical protein
MNEGIAKKRIDNKKPGRIVDGAGFKKGNAWRMALNK